MSFLFNFIRLVRFPNLVIIAITQYAIRFGIILPFMKQGELHLFMDEALFLCLVLATVLIAAAGYIINDYFDVKLDLLNKPKQLIIGKAISRREAMFLHTLLNIIGISLAIYVAFAIDHPLLVFFQIISAALLWFYSVNFKKQILIGNLIIAALTALVPFTAGYYEIVCMFDQMVGSENVLNSSIQTQNLGSLLFSIKYLLYWVVGYSIFAFLLTLIREIIKDCEDIEGDKAFDCKTLPIVYGINKAKNVAIGVAVFLLLGLLGLEIIQFISKDWISLGYFALLLSTPIVWFTYKTYRAQSKRDFFIVSQSIKVVMLFGILYTGLIYLF